MVKYCVVIGAFLASMPAGALIFRDGGSPAANTETAPTGQFANSGWQHAVRLGSFQGTIISPKHFITATHLGTAETMVTQNAFINGVEDRVYHIRSYHQIGSTDLRVVEIWETFDDYAELYAESDEATQEMTIFGNGFGEGVEFPGQGWRWGGEETRLLRWGRNVIDGFIDTSTPTNPGLGELLFFTFDDLQNQDEVMATGGDSGGGWFIRDGNEWKLAAVSFGVDGGYSLQEDSATFRASFYNAVGIYITLGQQTFMIPSGPGSLNSQQTSFYQNSHTYGSRISSNLTEIGAIINDALADEQLTNTERYESWLIDHGVSALDGVDVDSDVDGLTNLEEYLSDSDPGDGSEGRSPIVVSYEDDGSHVVTLEESLDLAGRGLSSSVQVSSDLVTWSEVTDFTEVTNTVDLAEGLRLRVLSRLPSTTGDNYYRLKIEINE